MTAVSASADANGSSATPGEKTSAVAPAQPRIARSFGPFEKYFEAQYFLEQYCGTTVTVRYVLPNELADMSRHSEAQQTIVTAVAQTVLDHPMLQVGVTKPGAKKPGFTKIDEINFDNHIEWHVVSPEKDYNEVAQRVISEQLDRRFTFCDTRPVWRLSMLRPEGAAYVDIIYIWRHTIHDGTGAKLFHRDLFKHLSNPPADIRSLGLNGSVLSLKGRNCVYPLPMTEMVKFPISPAWFVETAWKELKPAKFAKVTHTQSLWGPFKKGAAVTVRRSVRMDAARSKRILSACREHKTTLTGLIGAIAFVNLLHETADSGGPPSFEATTAVDGRRFMPERAPKTGAVNNATNTVANIVTLVDHEWNEEEVARLAKKAKTPVNGKGLSHMEDILWEVARKSRHDIEERLERGFKNDIMGLMGIVSDWNKEKEKMLKKPRRESWLVTNLGVLDAAPAKPEDRGKGWSVDRAWFALSAETGKPLFNFAVVGVKGGDVCIDIIWQDKLNEYVDRVASTLEGHTYRWLNYIATGEWTDDGRVAPFVK